MNKMSNKSKCLILILVISASLCWGQSSDPASIIGIYKGTLRFSDKRSGPLTIEIESVDKIKLHALLTEESKYGDYEAYAEQRIEATGKAIWENSQWEIFFDEGKQHYKVTQTDLRDGEINVSQTEGIYMYFAVIKNNTIVKHPTKIKGGENTDFYAEKDGEYPVEPTEIALNVDPYRFEILPDGQSTIKVTAQLYSYIPDDNSPSKPLPGKTLSFEIHEMDGVKPGKLSSAAVVTNANGMATITYTAPTIEILEKMRVFNRMNTTIDIRHEESGAEDIAYIDFMNDRGEIRVEPQYSKGPNEGFVPPHKNYPATIYTHLNSIYESNPEVTFSIRGDNPVGMLRSFDGREGRELTVKVDSERNASVQYFYAASTPPEQQITETIEAKTKNMPIPLKAYVSTGFNIILENAETVSDDKEFNDNERVPLKITVKDEWNPGFNLGEALNLWGAGEEWGENSLYVKLKIEKLSFVPSSMLDLMGEKNYPEPLYEELLRPQNLNGVKNILLLPDYSYIAGFPVVRPSFSGVTNYEISVSLVDEKGETVFESSHPRATTLLSIPSGHADAGKIWFASNPLGPHTPEARFIRMILSTVSFGNENVSFGVVISLADAAFAINNGDTEALVNVMLGEIKNKVLGDLSEKAGVPAERIGFYNNMAIAEQYVSFSLTTESDQGLIAQMESKILSGIASAGFGEEKQMVVLKGNGNQKLLVEAGQEPQSKLGKALKDNFKISFSGIDKETKEFVNKVGEKLKGKGEEIPCIEGKFNYDDKLDIISLKNGNVTIYAIPKDMKVTSENAIEMKKY